MRALKDTGEEVRIFLLHVAEQLNGEVTGALGKRRLSLMGAGGIGRWVARVSGTPFCWRVATSPAILGQPGAGERHSA